MAPLALVGAKLWPAVVNHPVTALMLFLGYQALVLAMGFALKVFGDLQSRWSKRAADAIDRRVLWRTSRFERDYRAHVVSHHRFIDLKGLATRGDFTPGLEDVFVDVSLAPRPAHETSQDPLAGTTRPGTAPVRQSIVDFLGRPEASALAVIGAPGTGKTTLLKHLALNLAQAGHRRGTVRDLPVLLLLRDHAEAIRERPDIGLTEVIRRSLRRLASEIPAGWFEQQLQDGRCVVLLDGLDEVARDDHRRAVATWVEAQIEQYERNDFVLTSRPHGYISASLNRAQVLQVRRFTGEQITRFVHGWYRTIEKLATGMDDAGIEERASEEAEDLLTRLRARPVLYDLAANPLLLTMIANVHRYRGALPGSRAELYREICEVLLWRRQQAKTPTDTTAEVTGAKKEVVLRELAYRMMAERLRDIDAGRAAQFLRPALVRVAQTAPTEAADVFLTSITASGLLVERERGLYAFAHLTLQEHLASLHIQHHRLATVLAEAVDDPWWRETTLLYAARVDPAPIVEACLTSRTTTALALALDCADAATELAPDTASRLEALRQEALTEPVGSPIRQLMTAVTLTRRLQETVRLSDDTLVCARPVTREIYRLFAADHPETANPQVAEGPDDGPAVGMTRQETLVFVGWVNRVLPDGPGWRLPTDAEVNDPAFRLVAHTDSHPVWHLPPGDPDTPPASLPALWIPEGADHPWSTRLSYDTNDCLVQQTKKLLALGQLGFLSVGYHVLAQDLARTSALADVREITQAIGRASDLAQHLERDLARANDLHRSRTSDPARALILDRANARHLARDLHRANALNLARDLDLNTANRPRSARTTELAHVLARARIRARDLARVRALDLDLDVSADILHHLRFNSAQYHQLARILHLVLSLDSAQSLDLALVHDLNTTDDRVAAWVFATLSLLAGPQERSRWNRSEATSDREHIARPLRGDWGKFVVFPEDLAAAARTAAEGILSHLESIPESPALGGVIALLATETAPLFATFTTASIPPEQISAALLQLAALALAVAADQHLQDGDLARLYRTVAAGITVLQHRADGTIKPSEVIILARP